MIMWNAYYLTAPIWLIAVTRTGGILFGVLVAMLVSNVVFPQSLSASVLEDIATAGEQLAKQSDLLWASILSTKGFIWRPRQGAARVRGRGRRVARGASEPSPTIAERRVRCRGG